jgi:hypothetical protein
MFTPSLAQVDLGKAKVNSEEEKKKEKKKKEKGTIHVGLLSRPIGPYRQGRASCSTGVLVLGKKRYLTSNRAGI